MSNEKEIFESLFGQIEEEAAVSDQSSEEEDGMKINWKQKLSSRKLWAAILCAVFAVVTAIFGDELDAEAVEMLKTGIYGLIAYIFGEGVVDVARIVGQSKVDAVSAVPINICFGEETEGEGE